MKGIALYWLGECHLRRGDEQAARAAFQESLEVDPSLQQPRDALSRLDPT
jgi:TolA-binding protein